MSLLAGVQVAPPSTEKSNSMCATLTPLTWPEKPGTPKINVTIVTEIPEGATMLSDESVAALVALRKPLGYTATEVPAESFTQGVPVDRDGTFATKREP